MMPKVVIRQIFLCVLVFFVYHCVVRSLDIVYVHLLSHLCFCLVFLWLSWQTANVFLQSKKVDPCNKAIVITGCDSGFGYNLALQLDRLGYSVFAGCLFPDGEGAKKLLANGSENLRVLSFDVTKDESVNDVVTDVKKCLIEDKIELWGLVNNAGIGHYSGVDWSKAGIDDIYRSQIEVNTLGLVRVSKAFLPLLRKTKNSRIVLMASMASRLVFPGLVGYSMSKYAVRAFGDGLRREQRLNSLNVSIIEPAMYSTTMTEKNACLDNMRSHWLNTPDDSRESIGETGFTSLCKTVESFLLMQRNNVQEVLDAMIDSLTSEEPKCFYRVGGLKERIALYLLELLPEELQDFFLDSSTFNYILKLIKNKKQ